METAVFLLALAPVLPLLWLLGGRPRFGMYTSVPLGHGLRAFVRWFRI